MKTYFVNLRTQFGNTGDALINRELIREIRTYGRVLANCGKDVREDFIRDLEIMPEEQLKSRNTYIFSLKIVSHAIKAIFNHESVYVVGGLGDFYGGGYKAVLKDISVFFMYCVYRVFGVKIVNIGRSFNSLTKGREKSEKLRAVPVNRYYVRDSKTLDYCHQIGIRKAQYCPDLSWLLKGKKYSINKSNCVGITFRPSLDGNKEYERRLIEKINLLLMILQERFDAPLKVLIFHQVESDKVFMGEIYKYLCAEGKYEIEYISERLHLGEDEKLYSMCRYHISNRLHSLLLGYKYGSLPIALISKQNKKIYTTFEDEKLDLLILDLMQKNQTIMVRFDELLDKDESCFLHLTECENRLGDIIHNVLKNV